VTAEAEASVNQLTPADLLSLERYAAERDAFRARVIEHKRARRLAVGPNLTWCFEDRLTIQYQIQEMLRVERIFEAAEIRAELETYNPLIPDGTNWKATLLIEFPDVAQRQRQLALLKGIERRCWIEVRGHEPVYAIADEDLERENEEKTAAVHFLRFELCAPMIAALRAGAPLAAGVDHEHYRHWVNPIPEALKATLLTDLR
jgi:hypothetical protein